MYHRWSFVLQGTTDNSCQKNSVIARIAMRDWFALQMPQAIDKDRHGPSAVADVHTLKRRNIGFESFAKMFEHVELLFGDEVEIERRAGGEPFFHVAAFADRDGNHRGFETGLHDPTGQHSGRSIAAADCENKHAAGNASQDRVEIRIAHC